MSETFELLLDEWAQVTLAEVALASGLSETELRELVALGVLEPSGTPPEWKFTAQCIEIARTARRLQADFELELPAVALVLAYHERVRQLERQLRALTCQLPGPATREPH